MSRFLTIIVAAVLAVVLVKAVVAVAIVAALAIAYFFSINVARRMLLGAPPQRLRQSQPMRRVTPLASPTISVRR